MDIDDITIGRILSRREMLAVLGAAGMATLAGCGGGNGAATVGTTNGTTGTTSTTTTATTSSSSTGTNSTTSVVVTPAETEGPYFVDENLNRSDLTAGTTRASVINGLPLALQLKVYQVSGATVTPVSGAHVDIWHADALGVYSDESVQGTAGEKWLRGFQATDASGAANFTTIYAGWYSGRTAHIHFKVRLYSAAGSKTYEFTSQLFMDDAITSAVYANAPYSSRPNRNTTNANDSVYNTSGTNGAVAGSQLLLGLTPSGNGYIGTFSIGLQIA